MNDPKQHESAHKHREKVRRGNDSERDARTALATQEPEAEDALEGEGSPDLSVLGGGGHA
jgi:hypothetical protein